MFDRVPLWHGAFGSFCFILGFIPFLHTMRETFFWHPMPLLRLWRSSPRVLHVPRSMLDKSIPFDVQTAGSAIHIASGMMQLNSERQQLACRNDQKCTPRVAVGSLDLSCIFSSCSQKPMACWEIGAHNRCIGIRVFGAVRPRAKGQFT
jgi:hypothetical protein